MSPSPLRFRILLASAVAAVVSVAVEGQTAMPTVSITPATAPAATAPAAAAPAAIAPAPVATPTAGGTAAAGGAAAATPAAVTQPFIAEVTTDKVYVRSGPGTAYYEIGQLGKNDLVYVVGTSKDWYQILPPNGTYCMIAKEFVDVAGGAAGATEGTVKADYVNVRAGTALNKNRDPSVVLTVVRKGAKLRILGSTDKYYEIAPPEGTRVYISPQFVKQAPATVEYKVPELKLPAGVTGPSMNTVEAPTVAPTATVTIQPATPEAGGTAAAPETPAAPAAPGTVETPGTVAATPSTPAAPATPAAPSEPAVLPPPKVTFNEAASARYAELNTRYQEEANKPLGQQNVDPLITDFKALLAMENISPSVKAGTEARLAALDKLAAIQRLRKEQATADSTLQQQRDAYREQYESAEKAIAAAREIGPYQVEGVLQSSTIVQGKYALVNPSTGRVLAYVDPAKADVDIGSLVGKYVGVRGIPKKEEGSDITVIQVSSATLMPQPSTAK